VVPKNQKSHYTMLIELLLCESNTSLRSQSESSTICAFWCTSSSIHHKTCWHRPRISLTHLVTNLMWPHQPENPSGRPSARRISP